MDANELELIIDSKVYDKLSMKLLPIRDSAGWDEYLKVRNALWSKNIDNIVEVILSVYEANKELKDNLKKLRGELSHDGLLEMINGFEVMDKEAVIRERNALIESINGLTDQYAKMRKVAQDLFIKNIGMTPEDGRQMRLDYEQGKSFRELAKKYGCDKATVKRRLIKMEVTIRE